MTLPFGQGERGAGAPQAALVFDGTSLSSSELDLVRRCSPIVAADGAARQLLDAGLVPDWIVGDMDGLGEARAREAEAAGANLAHHPADKDRLDGSLATDKMLSLGPAGAHVFGATGGRIAMTLVNLRDVVRLYIAGLDPVVHAGDEALCFLGAGKGLVLGEDGVRFDVLAWEGPATVTITGARYTAHHLVLAPGHGTALSNATGPKGARVEVHDGLVLVAVGRPAD